MPDARASSKSAHLEVINGAGHHGFVLVNRRDQSSTSLLQNGAGRKPALHSRLSLRGQRALVRDCREGVHHGCLHTAIRMLQQRADRTCAREQLCHTAGALAAERARSSTIGVGKLGATCCEVDRRLEHLDIEQGNATRGVNARTADDVMFHSCAFHGVLRMHSSAASM